MRKRLIIPLLLALLAPAFASAANSHMSVDKSVLADKIKGGWAAKTIACTYGGPVEFIHNGTMIQDYTPIVWNEGRVKHYFETFPGLYDDIYVNIVLENVVDRLGPDAPADSFAVSFARAGFPLWHANQQAKYNILHGIEPSRCGYWENNPHADDIDFQIEADFIGLITPGMPVTASDIADRVGHIFNYGDGWYGGVYVAALYSMAFVKDNIEEVVTEALKTIPQQSDFYKTIEAVIKCHKEDPTDWKKAWFVCQRDWSSEVGCPDGVFLPFDIDAKINSAYVTIGLLYGGGDFFKTIDIAARCGQDADCNPATAGGVLGTLTGFDKIPRKWTASLDGIEHIPFAYTDISLDKLYDMTLKLAVGIAEDNGGKAKGNKVTIKLQQPVPVRYEKSFDGHYPLDKQPVNVTLKSDPTAVDYAASTGIVQKGYVKCTDPQYVAEVELTLDGKVIETAKLPVYTDSSIDNRRVDLFYRYRLPKQAHRATYRWLNPRDGAAVVLTEAVLYTDAPSTVSYAE